MKKLLAILMLSVLSVMASCSSATQGEEPMGEVEQAASSLYVVQAIRVGRSSSTLFEDNWGNGAVASSFSKITYRTINMNIVYRPIAVLTDPASICNGDYVHDSYAVLGYGISKLSSFDRAVSRGYVLVRQRNGQNDIPECNVVGTNVPAGFTLPDTFVSQYGVLSGSQAVVGASYTHDCASETDIGCGGGINLTHELLHGQPTFTLAENGSDFGHDGSINCSGSATFKWRDTNSNCAANSTGAPENFLDYFPDTAFPIAHREAVDETVENKYQAHWFDHVSRASSTLVYNIDPNLPGHTPVGPLKLAAHDTGSISPDGYYEIRIPRGDGATIYLEFRSTYYGFCPNADCANGVTPTQTSNSPGVYVWVRQANGQLYELQMCAQAAPPLNGLYFKGICPPVSPTTVIEGTLRIDVTNAPDMLSAQVTIHFQ